MSKDLHCKSSSSTVTWGRDEMNLAEFPLALLANRAPRDCKTLTFEDRIWDKGQRHYVDRRLMISGCDRFGLPTALDDEVILGLIQLTKLNGVKSRRVPFSRYQLIQLLNWRDDGKSYRRLDRSLNRWVGVTLFYDNAWWCRKNQCWVSERFHLLDNVILFGKQNPTGGKQPNRREQPLSSFTWNDVMFRSLQAGNLKKLNMDIYQQLKSSIAKRMYRFLDKHFYKRSLLELNLKKFAFEHIGLSRNYDVAQIKRRLQPAIGELEGTGVLKPLSREERFRKPSASHWIVVFQAGKKPQGNSKKPRPNIQRDNATSSQNPSRQPNKRDYANREWERAEKYLASLDAAVVRQVEQLAFESASDIARDGHKRANERGDKQLIRQYRQQMVIAYLRDIPSGQGYSSLP